MTTISLQAIPHFIVKETTLLEDAKRELLREIYVFFRLLLNVYGSIKMTLRSTQDSSIGLVGVDYCLPDVQLDITQLIEELQYLRFEKHDREIDGHSFNSQTLLLKKIQLMPVGDFVSLHDDLEIMPTSLGKFKTDRIYTIPVTRKISLLTTDYRWKNTLFALTEGLGEVCITVQKFTPRPFDVQYALQCLKYYIYTYNGKISEEEIQKSTKIYQSIISKEEIFRAKIHISGNNSEFLKLAFLRDIDLEVFDLSNNQEKDFGNADKEEKGFIKRLEQLCSLEEVMTLLTPPYTFRDALPGITHFVPKPFILPFMKSDESKINSLILGNLDKRCPLYISPDQLRRHIFVTGTSGSGKTHTVHHLLYQLRNSIPLLIIDPIKREYEDLMTNLGQKINIVDFKNDSFLHFNPFIPPENIKIYSHSTVLARALSILFPTNEVAYELILNMIRETYLYKLTQKLEKVSLKDFLEIDGAYLRSNPNCIPNFDEFLSIGIQWLKNLGKNKGETTDGKGQKSTSQDGKWIQEAVQHFERRWDFLKRSMFKYIFSSNEPADKYFESNYLIELYNILDPNESNAVFTLLVALLYEYRLSCGLQDELKHITVVEEAHRIIPSRQATLGENMVSSPAHEAANLLSQMLAEIRAFGEGVIVVDQSPSKILPDVLINSSTKIIHRILYGVDKECLGQAMSLTQRETDYLSYLATGEAIIFTADAYQPVYVTVPGLSKDSTV